jgi:tetratricopeptide (TPR) repeat protein
MDYFEDDYYEEEDDDSYYEEHHLPNKKTFSMIIAIVLILIVASIIFFSGLNPGNKIELKSEDGETLSFTGTISVDGNIVDSFANEGSKISINSNGKDNTRIVISPGGISGINIKNSKIIQSDGRITLSTSSGVRIIPSDQYFIDEEGNIVIDIDPNSDIGINEDLFDFEEGDTVDFDLQIVLDNNETNEEYTFQIPGEIIFNEFLGTGCIQLSRGVISESTKYGSLEIDAKLKITCNSNSDLYSFVEWSGNKKGSVEVHFDRTYPTNLISDPLAVKSTPNPGEYDVKIIYTPSSFKAGEKANFKVNFELENSNQKLEFRTINENLEQCVMVETLDDTIENDSDTARISIDTTKCHNPVQVYVCDNDYGCSGGVEGAIIPSVQKLTLDKERKVVSFRREEIPGIYGATVHAKVSGFDKTFISEKEILVLPTDETIYPERFVISLLGESARDSVKITNENLSDIYEVEASICNLEESALGIEDGALPLMGDVFNSEGEWISSLINDPEIYSGEGFYQEALTSSLGTLSAARMSAYSTSLEENSKIKRAYLSVKENDGSAEQIDASIKESLDAIEELKNQIDDRITNEESEIATAIASLVSTITVLSTTNNLECTQITTTNTTATSFVPIAGECYPSASVIASNTTTAMNATCGSALTTIGESLVTINTIYSLYQQINSMSEENNTIDADSAVSNNQEANEKIEQVLEHSKNTLEYMDLALDFASTSDFTTQSDDYSESLYYLELALEENDRSVALLEEIRELSVEADDDITLMIEGQEDNTEMTIELISSVVSLLTMLELMGTEYALVTTNLTAAQTACTTAQATQATHAGACNPLNSYSCMCSGIGATTLPTLCTSITKDLSQTSSTVGEIAAVSSNIATVLSLVETYDALANDYVDELIEAKENYNTVIDDIDSSFVDISNASLYLEEAIPAAEKLEGLTYEPTMNSDYLNHLDLEEEFHDFDREKLVGLVSTIYQSGYVVGAYGGGVYSTRDDGGGLLFADKASFEMDEDCSNRIKLTLPDYKTNLVTDAGEVEIEGAEVSTAWIFNDAKVNGVFESQSVDLLFANDGLKQNKYATVEINFIENKKEGVVMPDTKFGPFNLPDSAAEEKSYKFHMKFNARPRTSSVPIVSSVCEDGVKLGATGSEALPSIILDWEYENVDEESTEDKYLDATQLSILLAKNISKIDSFLSNTEINCPTNPVDTIIDTLIPIDSTLKEQLNNFGTTNENCFMPLTTKTFDNYPGIYYYLDNEREVTYTDNLFELELPSDAEELLELMDFNVNLIRDGYGLDFQQDFTRYFTTKILTSPPSFLDPDKGISNYFRDDRKFFYTTDESEFKSAQELYLNDTGLFRVKLLIDFDEVPLMKFGRPTSKIKVQLEPIRPIHENFSPFYYIPFNGGVGADIDNARRFYGAGLSSPSAFEIIDNLGISLPGKQKDAFVQIDYSEDKDIFELNSLKSKRAKVLDVEYSSNNKSINYSPTFATPILLKLNGQAGQSTDIEYDLTVNTRPVDGKTYNLFLLDGLNSCKDFYGNDLSQVFDASDNLLGGSSYGFSYPNVAESGSVYFKTIAYAPIDSDFAIDYFESRNNAQIISVNENEDTSVEIKGIDGMIRNNKSNDDYLRDLKSIFDAIENNSLCVARLGEREKYYWSEEDLYRQESSSSSSNRSLEEEINQAKLTCIK